MRGQALRADHRQPLRSGDAEFRVGGSEQNFVGLRLQLDREECSLAEEGVEVVVLGELPHQRKSCRAGQLSGRVVCQVSAPRFRRGIGAFEAILPHGHTGLFQLGTWASLGKEDGCARGIGFCECEGPVQHLFAGGRRAGGRWCRAANGQEDGRSRKLVRNVGLPSSHMPRASASPSARMRTSSSRK